MPTYRLQITRVEKNQKYDPDLAQRLRPYNEYSEQPFIEERDLACSISEEEFAAIKQALLTIWK